jgi:uncharacterized membrane protein YvbJ
VKQTGRDNDKHLSQYSKRRKNMRTGEKNFSNTNILKRIVLTLLFVITIIIVSLVFTRVNTHAIGAESFESAPIYDYNDITNLAEL